MLRVRIEQNKIVGEKLSDPNLISPVKRGTHISFIIHLLELVKSLLELMTVF